MIRHILIFVLIGFIALSCDKVEKMEDDIAYKGFNPYLLLNPADSVGHISNSTCSKSFPFPADSSVSLTIDIDHDGVDDFSFTYSTSYNLVSPSDSCYNYSSKISVQGTGIGNNILVKDKNTTQISAYELDSPVIAASLSSYNAIIYFDNASGSNSFDFDEGNKYIGFQLANGKYGWMRVFFEKDDFSFTIMDYAYNNNVHLGIKAGQKE